MFKWMRCLCATLLCLSLCVFANGTSLFLRPIFFERVNLQTYNHPADSERYLALPVFGRNFKVNSWVGYSAGRYYLKGKVAVTVIAAYDKLEQIHPQWRFIYAEMGWNGGGSFYPHRTHRQGLSADFITPVYMQGPSGEKVPTVLPVHVMNLWGYGIRVNDQGRFGAYHFDTEAMIAHIAALKDAGHMYGIRIKQVILDPPLVALLKKDKTFSRIADVKFMKGRAWFAHDGHYHIDFESR